jgi:hypothetical protein
MAPKAYLSKQSRTQGRRKGIPGRELTGKLKSQMLEHFCL